MKLSAEGVLAVLNLLGTSGVLAHAD